jgi:transketolase
MSITEQELRPDVVMHTHADLPHPHPVAELDRLCVNTIRAIAMDAVEAANSGHPGTPMALAPVAYMLWTRFLEHDPSDPAWPDRDRFVLSAGGVSARVVSMPSWELFERRSPAYHEEVLPRGVRRLAIEAGRGFGWCSWADDVISLDRFGASAPAEVLFREFGFTPEAVAARAKRLLGKE